mmetsp:Transcript_64384/g.121990  ORF Transcript_64384/g.121990 Transcript_64384/m.121990 type:complete len:618 (+) Transcript_64384:54-1907(+)
MAISHTDVAAILKKHGYQEIKKVGEGSFGKAILVQTEDGSKLICKMVDISKASAKETQDAIKEGKLLSSLKHPYIVRYRENFSEKGWFCILMDYCQGGDLSKQIDKAKKSRQPFSEDQVLRWLTQALLGLKYIHDKHILHRDLKPSNFFLSKNGSLKMGDFGIAKVLSCTMACARTQIGTPYYLSPEVCQEKPYAWSSDIWAMGCILYELCALKVPFDAPSISGLVQKICRGPIPRVPESYSAFTRQLCAEMLNRTPGARPDPESILQRPRIQSIVKEMLEEAQAPDAALDAPPERPLKAPAVDKENLHPGHEAAGHYKKGDLVEYHSSAHRDWLNASVVNTDPAGRIIIDLKPNTWISKEEQAAKIRPRRGNVPPQKAVASPMRQRSPSVGALRDQNQHRGIATPMQRRSPSVGAFEPKAGTPMLQRSPSVGAVDRGRPVERAGAVAFKKNDLVEYYSGTHKDWLPAVVINVDENHRVVIDLKPNTWMSKDEQASKIRPRKTSDRNMPPRASASPMRHRSASRDASPARDFSPARYGPSVNGSKAGTPRSRHASPSPAVGSRGETPSRCASPRAAGPAPVGNGTPRMRPPGIPRVSDSPMRRRSAVGAAGMAIAGS